MSKLFGDAGASTQDLARLAEDKKAQGLSGARIIRLALALELGRLPAHVCAAERPPMLCEINHLISHYPYHDT